MSIGEKIREARELCHLKQAELAERIDANTVTISRWERNVNVPNSSALKKLASALNTTVAYLSGETDTSGRARTSQDIPEEKGDHLFPIIGKAVELPVYSLAACMGKGIDNESEPREQVGTAWLNEKVVGPLGPIKPYLINVEGTSMEPKIYEGDRLLINENVMPGDGDVCLARFTREGYLRDVIKYYYSTYDGGFILKSSETSGIPPLKISRQQAVEREAFVVGRAMYIDRGEKI